MWWVVGGIKQAKHKGTTLEAADNIGGEALGGPPPGLRGGERVSGFVSGEYYFISCLG